MVGAGLIGRHLSTLLVERGDAVSVVTRSGTSVPGAQPVSADAADAAALAAASDGADTLFLCTSPKAYTAEDWQHSWPPVFRAAIAAAHDSGAGLVTMGNLYPYGLTDGPMTEHSPENTTSAKGLIRKAGWEAVEAAHENGEIRAVEVRASDYFGPGAGAGAHLGERFFAPILESKTAQVVGDPDAPHSWSYLDDIAATLAAAGDYTGEWGRVWHVPSGAPHPRTEIAATLNGWFGCAGRVHGMPQLALRSIGLFSPAMRGVADESYQFRHPFVIDASESERMLGVHATPWDEALRTTAESYRSGAR